MEFPKFILTYVNAKNREGYTALHYASFNGNIKIIKYLLWYYTFVEYGKWKRCSRCGQIKLAHNRFFSKNKTSKDGWYSICKCCRNAKTKDKNK